MAVLGSLNTDLVVDVPRLPRPGETVAGGALRRLAGGKGANQAVAARRLGADVTMIGAVGDDDLGTQLLGGLHAEGVRVDAVRVVPGTASGVALIVVEPGGENTITVAPGANAHLGPDGVGVAHDVLVTADVLLLQLEVPPAASRSAARVVRQSGGLVVLNAAPLSDPLPADVRELVSECDVVVVNEQEAEALATGEAALPDRLVVTLGARGARWSEGSTAGSCPAFPVDSVDAVGAGDAFVAAVAVGLAEDGDDLGVAVRFGCAAGALATLSPGAQAGLPTRAQVGALLAGAPGA